MSYELGTTQNHVSQEDPWAKGCTCLPHSIGSTHHRQHRINFPTVSRIHLPAVSHTHPPGGKIPGQLRSPPDSWLQGAGCQHGTGMVTKNQPSQLFRSTSSQAQALPSVTLLLLTAPHGTWLPRLWHASHAKAWSVLQVRHGHVKTSVLFREAGTGG